MLAAQGDDVGCSAGGPVHACLFGALGDDRFAACFYVAGAGEHAQVAEVGVAHPVGVVLEVTHFGVQFAGFGTGERVLAGGLDDRADVPGVELGEPFFQPLGRVGGDEREVVREVVEVLAGVPDVGDVGGVRVELASHGPDPGGAVADRDDLAEVL